MIAAGFKANEFEIHRLRHEIVVMTGVDVLTVAKMVPKIFDAGLGVRISEYKCLGWFVDVVVHPGIEWLHDGAYIEEDNDPDYHKRLVIEINRIKQQYAGSGAPVASASEDDSAKMEPTLAL